MPINPLTSFPALAIRPPNVAGALTAASNLRGAETRNRLLDAKLKQTNTLTAMREKMLAGNTQTGAQPTGGAPSVDRDLMRQFMALDPQGGAAIIGAIDKMNDAEREDFAHKQKVAVGLAYQLQSAPPLERQAMYPRIKATAARLGLDVSGLPEQYDPRVVQTILMRSAGALEYAEQAHKMRPTKSELVKVMTPKGPKYVKAGEAAGKTPVQSGIALEFGPEGQLKSFRTGAATQSGLQKGTVKDIETKLFNAKEGLARLNDVAAGFKPEYQTWATRGKNWWNSVKEKAGQGVPEDERRQLAEFSIYRRDAIDNINRYIKEITGAQMSESEAKRLRKGMPDAGEGIFDGDSPTEFRAKLISTIRSLRLAAARYTHALRQGLDPKNSGITLDGIRKIMERRQKELIKEIRANNPDISDESLSDLLQQQLGREFGLL